MRQCWIESKLPNGTCGGPSPRLLPQCCAWAPCIIAVTDIIGFSFFIIFIKNLLQISQKTTHHHYHFYPLTGSQCAWNKQKQKCVWQRRPMLAGCFRCRESRTVWPSATKRRIRATRSDSPVWESRVCGAMMRPKNNYAVRYIIC